MNQRSVFAVQVSTRPIRFRITKERRFSQCIIPDFRSVARVGSLDCEDQKAQLESGHTRIKTRRAAHSFSRINRYWFDVCTYVDASSGKRAKWFYTRQLACFGVGVLCLRQKSTLHPGGFRRLIQSGPHRWRIGARGHKSLQKQNS